MNALWFLTATRDSNPALLKNRSASVVLVASPTIGNGLRVGVDFVNIGFRVGVVDVDAEIAEHAGRKKNRVWNVVSTPAICPPLVLFSEVMMYWKPPMVSVDWLAPM